MKSPYIIVLLTIFLFVSGCSSNKKDLSKPLEEFVTIVSDQTKIMLRSIPAANIQTGSGKIKFYLQNKNSLYELLKEKYLPTAFISFIEKNYGNFLNPDDEIRVFPSTEFINLYKNNSIEQIKTLSLTSTITDEEIVHFLIFHYLDWVVLSKKNIILMENHYEGKELNCKHKKMFLHYSKTENNSFRNLKRIHILNFSKTNPQQADTILTSVNEQNEIDMTLQGLNVLEEIRKIIAQNDRKEILRSSRFLQVVYGDFFTSLPVNKEFELDTFPTLLTAPWLNEKAESLMNYLQNFYPSIENFETFNDSLKSLQNVLKDRFVYLKIKDYGWVLGNSTFKEYNVFIKGEKGGRLSGMVNSIAPDSLFDHILSQDINFDNKTDFGQLLSNDSGNYSASYFLISSGSSYRIIPKGVLLYNPIFIPEDKVILSTESFLDTLQIFTNYFQWQNDTLKRISTFSTRIENSQLIVTICIDQQCNEQIIPIDKISSTVWKKLYENSRKYPPDFVGLF